MGTLAKRGRKSDYITYNTAEELVRVSPEGVIEPAAMSDYRWVDDHTFEVEAREGERFPDGEPLTALSVKRSFDECMRWAAPHPPGTQFNLLADTSCEMTGEQHVRSRGVARYAEVCAEFLPRRGGAGDPGSGYSELAGNSAPSRGA